MTPVAPIPPIDPLASIGSAGAAGTPQPAAAPELRQRFETLMQRHGQEVAAESTGKNATAIGGMIDREQSGLNELQSDMTSFIEHMPSMDATERTAGSMMLMDKVSEAHIKMSLTMGVTKSSTKSLQSLLKNE
ncbi:MAG: hypothetical protein ACTHL8_01610 [Burkholderiaceae bacterium]